jgi:hypothetical protein
MRLLQRIRAAILAALLIAAGALPARADDLKIHSPIIEPQELEFENNFTIGQSKNIVSEVEYGFNDWLKLGIEGELAADPGQGFHYDAAALEGYWQMTPQGKYWADVGLFAEYENTARTGDPRSLTIGPMVQKQARLFGLDTLHTVNAFLIKDMGASSVGVPDLFVADQSLVLVNQYVNPGLEYYGHVSLGDHGPMPQHRAGPALAGLVRFREFGINMPGGIKYDTAYLRGFTDATDRNTFRIRFEFEFPL